MILITLEESRNAPIKFINLKTEKMKKLFCVVVTDVEYIIGMDSPIIFHMRCDDPLNKVEEAVKEMLVDEYNFLEETVEQLDIFTFEVRDVDIIELD